MQPITAHLRFDKGAREAAGLYASSIPDSRLGSATSIIGTP
ncbi:MAG: hypothetical protein ACYC96_14930 [Fimbriimonadaceae bacterium]